MGLMGLILVAISVEMLLRGIQLLITQTRAAG
jgi:small neutral amino acid transporter SnatA (MarC family)